MKGIAIVVRTTKERLLARKRVHREKNGRGTKGWWGEEKKHLEIKSQAKTRERGRKRRLNDKVTQLKTR